ncbi:MAG TPA: hypothetical protein VGO53_13825, partial [Steroidobacteraceae bacterium]|nr:hypothetical protein [Steroidobacteraceae bacterium]
HIPLEDVEIVEGSVQQLVTASGMTDFRVGEHSITLNSSRATRRLREGDKVRLMVPARTFKGFLDVLALQRVDDGRVHYTGSQIDPLILLCAAAVSAFGIHLDVWWLALLPALPVGMLFYRYDMQRLEAIRRFSTHLAELPVDVAETNPASVR